MLPGLRCVDTGAGAPAVVLQHGLCGSADQTIELFPLDATARFLTLECRGHGQSPIGPFEALSIATFAEDVRALIDTMVGAPVIAGGVSMGAAIATRLAVKHPHLVRGLVLVRPAWICAAAPQNMAPNLELGRLLGRLPGPAAKAAFLASETAHRLERESPDNLASLTGFFSREPLDATGELLRRISLDGPGIEAAELRKLQMPALVIGCAQDAIHPLDMARSLAALIADAEFVEVTPKAVDRSAYVREVQSAIARFLRSHAR